MGYASDMQDLVLELANIIKGADSNQSVGHLKDYIAYSEERRSLRSYLYEIDPESVIEPHTALHVDTSYDDEGYMESATVMKGSEPLISLDRDQLDELDIQDDEGVLGWYYDQYMRGN